MDLTDKVKGVVLEDISKRAIISCSYDENSRNFVKYLLSSGILKDTEIDSLIEGTVISEAVKGYNKLLHNQSRGLTCYPDHDIMPEYLAYAIKNNKLPANLDMNQIKFDHGETPDSFAKQYCPDNLIVKLRENLLNPKPLPAWDGDYDPHPVCLDCH